MEDHNDKDELWDLLGKAKKPAVSMRFTQDVLRAVEKEQKSPGGWFPLEWLRRALAPAAVSFAALTLFGVLWMSNTKPRINAPDETAFEEISNMEVAGTEADFEIIDNLDGLLAIEENQVWLDDSPPF